MRVMTSHYEISVKPHLLSQNLTLQSIIYPPEKKKNIGTNSILARGESRMLPNDPLFTLHSVLI